MLAIKHKNGDPYLYVFGGRGGDNTVQNRPQVRCCYSFLELAISGIRYLCPS
jgi:hypothetical protein